MKRMSRNRRHGMLGIVLASTALLGACASGGAEPEGGDDDTLVWGKAVEVTNFDPHTSLSAADGEVLNRVYEPLVTVDDNLEPAPALAESWEQVSPTEYVFDIRDGARFSDGSTLVVEDVVRSIERIIDPETASLAASFLPISSVEATDDQHVRIVLSEPTASLFAALASTAAAILPMREFDKGTFDPKTQFLGTGPYVVKDHVNGESWDLVANDEYWGEAPAVSNLEVKVITDDTARIAALRDGSIDFTNFSTPDAPALLESVPSVTTQVLPSTDYYRLDVNALSSIFKDERLRHALALAINRDELAETALGGTGSPVVGAAPPGLPVTCDAESLPFAEPDPEEARRLVAEANGGDTPITILAATSDGGYGAIAQVLQQQLEGVGFDVSIETLDNGVWLERVFGGSAEFDTSISWFAGYADPGMVLGYWNPERSVWNKSWMPSDPAVNAAIQSANQATDGRQTEVQQVCELIANGANMIPLVGRSQSVAYASDVVAPTFPAVEGYGDPFRLISSFEAK